MNTSAVVRNLRYIAMQVTNLADEIEKAERGEYTCFMDDDTFEATLADAMKFMGIDRANLCLGLSKPHRCSFCENTVRHWMEREKAA